VSECEREALIMRRTWPTEGLLGNRERKVPIQDSFRILLSYSQRRTDADTYPDVHTLPDKRDECYTHGL